MLKKEKWKLQFTMIALGQAVSMLGSHGVQFALIWWLAEKTSSPLMLGISGLVAYLPMSLLSPLAGIMADRLNRKAISIVSDMGMGITAVLYAFGTAWICVQAGYEVAAALGVCVFPFVPGDLVKIAAALAVGPVLQNRLAQAKLSPAG